MCGINGITNIDDSAVRKMAEATSHRGPDGRGFFSARGITFAHNRLAVIDLSPEANQPMQSPDKRYTLIFNGEIYNYRELRAELVGWNFKTQSDSEVLLAGYATWGREVLNKLKGIFAFAIWDTKEGELLLVRDHMGVKPLYYAIKDDVLYFSSELRGVIEGTGYRTLSREGLAFYVTLNYVPSPYTLVEGISKLPPAHFLSYHNGVWKTERYWVPAKPTVQKVDHKELRNAIAAGVERQLVSDRPLGVFLSGGLDSSIVVHHASTHMSKLRTFSVDFEMVEGAEGEAAKFNSDAALAKKSAGHYGTEHKTFTLTLPDVRNNLEAALLACDEPVANPTVVSQYLLSKWVREAGIVVALGGDGGDELFGGYTRHRITLGASYFQRLPKILQKSAGLIHSRANKLSIPLGVPLHMQLLALKPQKYSGLFTQREMYETAENFFMKRYSEESIAQLLPIDQFMRVDRETWLADESLARTDRTSMSFGLEARVPLLDIDTVRFADTMVGEHKFKPWSNKKILRDAYRGHLPEHLYGQPKRGWISPGAKWLRDTTIRKYAQEVLSPHYHSGLDGLFNWEAIQTQFEEHLASRSYHLYPLWNILQLQVWARKYDIHL